MLADGTVYVVSAKDTDKFAARAAMEDLKRNGARIIGTVLTKVENIDSGKYGYGSYYGNYYGENG